MRDALRDLRDLRDALRDLRCGDRREALREYLRDLRCGDLRERLLAIYTTPRQKFSIEELVDVVRSLHALALGATT